MTFRVEVVCLHDGGEQRCNVMEMERVRVSPGNVGNERSRRQGDSARRAGLHGYPTSGRRSETPACLFGLRAALSQ